MATSSSVVDLTEDVPLPEVSTTAQTKRKLKPEFDKCHLMWIDYLEKSDECWHDQYLQCAPLSAFPGLASGDSELEVLLGSVDFVSSQSPLEQGMKVEIIRGSQGLGSGAIRLRGEDDPSYLETGEFLVPFSNIEAIIILEHKKTPSEYWRVLIVPTEAVGVRSLTNAFPELIVFSWSDKRVGEANSKLRGTALHRAGFPAVGSQVKCVDLLVRVLNEGLERYGKEVYIDKARMFREARWEIIVWRDDDGSIIKPHRLGKRGWIDEAETKFMDAERSLTKNLPTAVVLEEVSGKELEKQGRNGDIFVLPSGVLYRSRVRYATTPTEYIYMPYRIISSVAFHFAYCNKLKKVTHLSMICVTQNSLGDSPSDCHGPNPLFKFTNIEPWEIELLVADFRRHSEVPLRFLKDTYRNSKDKRSLMGENETVKVGIWGNREVLLTPLEEEDKEDVRYL
ncbi:hypothetical protein QBC38DRAFT_525598 [Podospora fimiseda]|uniref:Uncharacterized protein n=1 Tax=Podospora fimiseda TaxID=252190 RepID=A0AAN7BYE8_9PEZI|nr:hypothetical protein QBC38DRAFT_525598 [Podospora fimiseda]